MFDAKRLLEQFVGGGGRQHGGSYGQPGPSGGQGGSPLGQIARSLGGGSGGLGGAGALGLAGLLLGSKKGRKLGMSGAKVGGMALVGSLAYKAYQDWQASQAAGSRQAPGGTQGAFGAPPAPAGQGGFMASAQQAASLFSTPPAGTPFNPASEPEQQHVGRTLLMAMISAAKADGHIDADEQSRIFGEMDKLSLDSEDKAFVMDALRAPLDVDGLARLARGPEEAAEIYAASLLAVDVDSPAERAYLSLLAARLNLDDALVQHLHATVKAAEEA